MNKYSKQILKYLTKNYSVNEIVKINVIHQEFNFDKDTINNSLELLKNNNMIVCDYKQTFVDKKLVNLGIKSICLTTIGKEYFKNTSKEKLINVLRYLLFNIITPIIVAYITARVATTNTTNNNDCCNNTNNQRNNNIQQNP